METVLRVLGVDLGQASDYTAAALLERAVYEEGFVGPADLRVVCSSLGRAELGRDYTKIVERILHKALDPAKPIDIITLDFTGVGRPVVDLLRQEAARVHYPGRIRPIALAASDAATRLRLEERGSHWVVPKVDLVASILLLGLAQQRLVLPSGPEVEALFREMEGFRMRATAAAHLQLGTERTGHDDLIIALGLACWWMLRFGGRRPALVWGESAEVAQARFEELRAQEDAEGAVHPWLCGEDHPLLAPGPLAPAVSFGRRPLGR